MIGNFARVTVRSYRSKASNSMQRVPTNLRLLATTSGDPRRYLHETYLPTDHFQDSLPTLPIPKLEDTLKSYAYHANPLLESDEARETTSKVIEDFLTADGPRLQSALVERNKGKYTSYIRDPWFDMYLRARTPLLLNWNPALTFMHDPRGPISQTKRAAGLIYSAVTFYRTLRDGHLKPDLFETKKHISDSALGKRIIRYTPRSYTFYTAAAMGAYALDMSQYENLFHSTRVPREELDELVVAPSSHAGSPPRHVIVQNGGGFYALDVLDANGDAIVPEKIEAALDAILEKSEEDAKRVPVGALTTLPRDEWARRREELASFDAINRSSLEDIDGALFAVSLSDEVTPDEDVERQSRCMLHGNARDRWLDKSFQLVVTRDGEAAINFEHSWGDGIAVVRFANEVYDMASALDVGDASNVGSDDILRPVEWTLSSSLESAVRDAGERADAMIGGVDFAIYQTEAVTSDWVKGRNLSPDGLLQMLMQLAHYQLKGRPGSTYESATTAAFKHGRTETIRTVTPESMAMCKAFFDDSNATVDQQEEALRAAVKTHGEVTMRALKGQGMDRHLFVLRALALEEAGGDESRLPSFFKDVAWSTLSNIILSTSTLPSPALKGGGFGPVGPDCYAVGYGVRKQGCRFSIMTNFEGAQDFADSLGGVVGRVENILSK